MCYLLFCVICFQYSHDSACAILSWWFKYFPKIAKWDRSNFLYIQSLAKEVLKSIFWYCLLIYHTIGHVCFWHKLRQLVSYLTKVRHSIWHAHCLFKLEIYQHRKPRLGFSKIWPAIYKRCSFNIKYKWSSLLCHQSALEQCIYL